MRSESKGGYRGGAEGGDDKRAESVFRGGDHGAEVEAPVTILSSEGIRLLWLMVQGLLECKVPYCS